MRIILTALLLLMIANLHCAAQNLARFSDIPAGMTDSITVQQALKIANQRAVNLRCPEDYTKGTIISRHWQRQPDRDGNTIARVIHIQLYCHFPEGRCAMTDMTFRRKKLQDGTWSRRLYYVGMGDMLTVECE